MKLIKRVKLKRVKYGDLDEGDPYRFNGWPNTESIRKGKEPFDHYSLSDRIVIALNTTKYPPESVTYDIVGIDASDFMRLRREVSPLGFLRQIAESEIETVYE